MIPTLHKLLIGTVFLTAAGCGDAGTPGADPDSGGRAGSGAEGGRGLPTSGGTGGAPSPSGTGGAPSPSGAGGAPSSGGSAPQATGGSKPSANGGSSGGVAVPTTPGSADQIPAVLLESLEKAATADASSLLADHALPLVEGLPYDPLSAEHLPLIQSSALAFSDAELAKLATNGFVISASKQFPTFSYGYKNIYAEDLPLYVSADSVLFAVHRSFDLILQQLELAYLRPELEALLDGMRAALPNAGLPAPLSTDLDLYLTLGRSLLGGAVVAPVAGADPAEVQAVYELAVAAQGARPMTWFGSQRDEDFSQFEPRGHYAGIPELESYFRAMMLLGRVDLRLIETQADGSTLFHRRQFDAAVALGELVEAAGAERWTKIDAVIGSFIGERDSMTPDQLAGLLAALGATDFESTRALGDAAIADEIARGGWGAQRIASRIIVNGTPDGSTLPLDRSFALFGQRYTVDSHVFVNTTYDRVAARLMPDPLDVAFGALANDAALEPLAAGLSNTSYASGLAKTRTLVDAHDADYWDSSLYTTWLSALRTLSPTAEALAEQPAVFSTRAGQTRILNTQLASWAELRHDTILYVKQSYTAGPTCEFPDAYVDPYPELYARLARFAERLGELVADLPDSASSPAIRMRLDEWVMNFVTAMGYLERMAENQRTGTPHDAELMEFINAAVSWTEQPICGAVTYSQLSGWYLRLFFDPIQGFEDDPTIADVHTQPFDEGGNEVGKVLHVGTGRARLLGITVETCSGPRAYVGLVSSFGQVVEENWNRLTDPEWLERIDASDFPDPPWMTDLLAR